MCSFLNKL